jgi:hypothetical protein
MIDMTGQVVHHPRLAWDAASVFVRALRSDQVCRWLGGQLGRKLGPAYQRALSESRDRLWSSDRPDAPQVESGLWRARLEDLLRAGPEMAGPLQTLAHETSALLERAVDVRPYPPAREPAGPRVIDLDRFRR